MKSELPHARFSAFFFCLSALHGPEVVEEGVVGPEGAADELLASAPLPLLPLPLIPEPYSAVDEVNNDVPVAAG